MLINLYLLQRSAEYEDMWETISIWTNDVESYQCLGVCELLYISIFIILIFWPYFYI